MKNKIILGIILLISLVLVEGVLGADYYVATTGNDLTGNGSLENPWQTISYAITQTPDGNIINVGVGTYTINDINNRLTIQGKQLTLRGIIGPNKDSSDSSVVEFTYAPQTGIYDVEIYASGTIVQDFVFHFEGIDGDRGGLNTVGIVVGEAGEPYPIVENVQILNNIIYSAAVAIQSGSSIDVDGLIISSNTIHLDEDGDGVFNDWDVAGIYINPNAGDGSVIVSENIIDGHIGYGIAVDGSNVIVSGNTIDNTVGTGDKAAIRYIDWYGNDNTGVIIEDNTASNMPKGIWVNSGWGQWDLGEDGSTGTFTGTIQLNTINSNDIGIWLGKGVLPEFVITKNTISGNTNYGIENTEITSITAKNNWWGTNIESEIQDLIFGDVDYSNWALDASIKTFQIEDIDFDEDNSKIIDLDDYYLDYSSSFVDYSSDSNVKITKLENNEIEISATKDWSGFSDVSIFAFSRPQNTFTVTVNPVNDAPVITDIPNQTIDEAQTFAQITLDNYVDDVDNSDSEIIWTYSGNTELTISIADRIATITIPNLDWFGTETITFTANDSELTDSVNVIFTVTNVNDAPIITAIADKTATEGTEFLYQVIATDADQDLLTYSLTNKPDGMIITSTGLIWWIPTNTQALTGTASVTVKVSDGTAFDTESFIITITNVNNAPVLTAIGTQQPVLNKLYTYQVKAEDVDTLTLTFSDNTTLFNINPTTGIISFTPTLIGQYNVEITVSDGELTDSEIVLFDITKLNQAPVSIIIPAQSWNEGENKTLNLTNYFSDPDSDALTFSIKTQPEIITASLAGDIVTFTQDENFFGTDSIVFTASDGINTTDSNTVILTVINVNDEPEITDYSPKYNPTVKSGTAQIFSINATDIDQDTLTTTWYVNNILEGTGTSRTITRTTAQTSEVFAVRADVSDGTVTKSQNWNLTAATVPIANTFTQGTTNFSLIADLTKAENVVLVKNQAKIKFLDAVDLSEVIDLDNNIIIENNIVGINTDVLTTLKQENATITMNVNLNSPVIYYTDEFITTYDLTNAKVCDFCTITSYNKDTGELIFTVDHFTTFMAGEEVLELDIINLEVKVDSKTDKDVKNREKISREALPGNTVKLKVDVKNNLQDLKIEDIYVEGTLIGIDDGEDLDEESKEFDLGAGRDKTITLTFNIPKKIDEDIYDVDIYVNGKDENGTEHEVEWTVYLEVKKKKHNIAIERAELLPEKLSCVRNTKLSLEIINYGQEEEEEVSYSIFSEALGIDTRSGDFELSEDLFDEDSKLRKSIPIKIAENFESGEYPITIKAFYDSKLDDTQTVNLIIEDCEVKVKKVEEKLEVKKEEDKEIPLKKEPVEISFRETPEYLALLVGGIVIILVLIILGFVAVAVRRK